MASKGHGLGSTGGKLTLSARPGPTRACPVSRGKHRSTNVSTRRPTTARNSAIGLRPAIAISRGHLAGGQDGRQVPGNSGTT